MYIISFNSHKICVIGPSIVFCFPIEVTGSQRMKPRNHGYAAICKESALIPQYPYSNLSQNLDMQINTNTFQPKKKKNSESTFPILPAVSYSSTEAISPSL